MDNFSLYRSKLTSAEDAVSTIRSGTTISMGMAMSEPPALLGALAARLEANKLRDVKIYYFESTKTAGDTILRYELLDRIKPYCMFMSRVERELIKRSDREGRKVVYFVPCGFSQAVRCLTEHVKVDTFLVTVSPMDRHGYFTFGTGNDYSSAVARSAERLIVEVNDQMPRVFGRSLLHVSEVDAIVENNMPLPELPIQAAGPEDHTIAHTVAEMVPDGACLQMGVGSLPNLVCGALEGHKDLGIHTECFTPGMANLMERGAVNNRRKQINVGKTIFTFAMGQKATFQFLHDNPAVESYPVDYVNDPAVIAKNDNFVSINSALQIDLTGACNAEHLLGHQYSASGGQLDFVRGAYASRGGKSIIAVHSTAAHGKVSRIVPRLDGPVTTARNDVQYVITEFGSAELKGKSSTERALTLIQLAHPQFRDDLLAQAKQLHLV
jgi:itaconate CoA-transferase